MTNPTEAALRKQFEEWYSVNAFDYAANPIGSRDCDLQWRAWKGLAALSTPAPDPVGMAEPESEPVIVWSRDGERFDEDGLQELIASHDLQVGDVVSRGEKIAHDPTEWVHSMDIANDILERLSERSYDECGEFAEDYPNKPSNEALDELDAFLDAWLPKHFQPSFWGVVNMADYTITQADVDEVNGSPTPPTNPERAGA